jgi:hypothetical protein
LTVPSKSSPAILAAKTPRSAGTSAATSAETSAATNAAATEVTEDRNEGMTATGGKKPAWMMNSYLIQ